MLLGEYVCSLAYKLQDISRTTWEKWEEFGLFPQDNGGGLLEISEQGGNRLKKYFRKMYLAVTCGQGIIIL